MLFRPGDRKSWAGQFSYGLRFIHVPDDAQGSNSGRSSIMVTKKPRTTLQRFLNEYEENDCSGHLIPSKRLAAICYIFSIHLALKVVESIPIPSVSTSILAWHEANLVLANLNLKSGHGRSCQKPHHLDDPIATRTTRHVCSKPQTSECIGSNEPNLGPLWPSPQVVPTWDQDL